MMEFKKTITILLTVCIVASLAAITVNAALSIYGLHIYSSSSSKGNITGIVGGSTGNVYSTGTGSNTTGTVGVSTGNVYSTGAGNTTGTGTSV
jgi:hypothetical protein